MLEEYFYVTGGDGRSVLYTDQSQTACVRWIESQIKNARTQAMQIWERVGDDDHPVTPMAMGVPNTCGVRRQAWALLNSSDVGGFTS